MHPAIIIGTVRSLIVDVAMGQIPRSTERISSYNYNIASYGYRCKVIQKCIRWIWTKMALKVPIFIVSFAFVSVILFLFRVLSDRLLFSANYAEQSLDSDKTYFRPLPTTIGDKRLVFSGLPFGRPSVRFLCVVRPLTPISIGVRRIISRGRQIRGLG